MPNWLETLRLSSSWKRIRKELIHWLIFTGLFSLAPILVVYVALIGANRGQVPYLFAPLEGGELLVISAVVAVAGVGEVTGSKYKGEHKTYAAALAVLAALVSSVWFAAVVTPSKSAPNINLQVSVPDATAIATALTSTGPSVSIPALISSSAENSSQQFDYFTSLGSIFVFIFTLAIATYAKIVGSMPERDQGNRTPRAASRRAGTNTASTASTTNSEGVGNPVTAEEATK